MTRVLQREVQNIWADSGYVGKIDNIFFLKIQLTAPEKKCHFGFDSGKNVNFKLIGEDFFMVSISKIFSYTWISSHEFW